jgi:hypothetical protein
MIIAVDFDGTCVSHEFPLIGKDIGGAKALKQLTDIGHKLILFTMRSDKEIVESEDYNIAGQYLTDAVNWFKKNSIPLYGIQSNPTQSKWTTSPKCYAQLYIDDAAFGCPLKWDANISERPFVDWDKVMEKFV